MTTSTHILGIAFEGWGTDATRALGTVYYYGWAPPVQGSYAWVQALVEPPASVSTEVDPFDGDPATSSFTFDLSAADAVAEALMWDEITPAHSVAVGDPVAISDTAITLAIAAAYPDSGEVIWVGDEAMFIVSRSVNTLTIQRGYWGTTAQPHAEDAAVFVRMPYWRGRVVTLLEQNVDTGVITKRWRGLVEDITQDGPIISVSARELLGAIVGAEVNASAPALSHSLLWSLAGELTGDVTLVSGPRVAQVQVPPSPVFLQVDDALVVGVYDGSISVAMRSDARAGTTLLGSPTPEIEDEPVTPDRVYEVAAWVRAPTSLTVGEAPTLTVVNPFHPLSVVLQLLTSTGTGENGSYDTLGEEWGLGIDYLDWAAWGSEIAATPELVIDRLVLGWDGESVSVKAVCLRLMRAFGYFFGLTDDGLLKPARVRMLTEADLESTNALTLYPDGPLRLERRLQSSPAEVRARVGKLPWSDGRQIAVRAAERSKRRGRLLDQAVFEIDMSMFDEARVAPGGTLDPLSTSLVALLKLGLDQAPVIYGRVADPAPFGGGSLDLGAVVTLASLGGLQDAWLVDGQGQRVELDDSPSWGGLVISRRWDAGNHTYEVGVLLTNWRAGVAVKERAPSAILAAGSTTTVLSLKITGPHGDEPGLAFDVGDEINVCEPTGAVIEGGVVSARTASTLTLASALAAAPDENDVIRLAESVTFGSTRYSSTNRPVAYLAADADTGIEDNSGEIEGPDVWGTEVFGGTGGPAPAAPVFVAIDDDAVTTTTESDAVPWDSWIGYTLRDNASELLQRGHQIGWSPLVKGAGDYNSGTNHRAYASVERSTILYVPWALQPELRQVRVTPIARIATETANTLEKTGAQYTFTAELGRGADVVSKRVTYDVTQDDTTQFQPLGDIVVDVDSPGLNLVNLGVWGQSSTSHWNVVYDSTVARGGDTEGVYTNIGTPFVELVGARPAPGAMDTLCTEVAGRQIYDHLRPLGGLGDEIAAFGPRAVLSGDSVELRHLPYAQIKGLEIHQTFYDRDYQTDETLRPRRAVLSEADAPHVSRGARIQGRQRPIWVGPQGNRPGTSGVEQWPTDITQRWILQDAKGTSTETASMTGSVWLDTPEARIVVHANAVGLHFIGNRQRRDDPASRASTVQWEAWLTVEQLQDGDVGWADATEVATTTGNRSTQFIGHYPSVADGRYPLLYQHFLRRDYDRWPLKEGQLFESDLAYLSPISLSINVPDTFDLDRPARVTTHLRFVDVDWVETDNRTTDALDLLIVGASMWEVPR